MRRPLRVKPLFPSPSRKRLFFAAAVTTASVSSMYATAAGPYGTGAAPAQAFYLLCASSVALFLLAFMLRRRGSAAQRLALLLALLLPALAATGVATQNVVHGRPVLVLSELSRALDLADAAEADRQTLLSRQYLMSLPRAQARGLAADYEAAARSSLDIAARWNPASVRNLPGQGFEDVYDLLNRAADAQSDALRAYILNVESPQQALEEAASGLAAEAGRLLSDAELGAAIADARSGSVALLRRR